MLQVTVDQLRADRLARIDPRWGEGGLRRLLSEGVVFSNARHAHAVTETAVGHATLATGTDPAVHGIVGNSWFDRAGGTIHRGVEDAGVRPVGKVDAPRAVPAASVAAPPRVGPAAPAASAAAVASASPAAPPAGRSPRALLAPTLADAVAEAGAGKARVWSVSLKDRAAVPMAGFRGKALWWSESGGEFASSSWYFPSGELPRWVTRWNAAHPPARFDGASWDLLLPPDSYARRGADDEPWEQPPAGMGRTFPHRYDVAALGDGFGADLVVGPFGDRILLDFARELLRAESLGKDDVPDYLSVSFSSNDLVGHRFGPDSLEAEDELLRLDRSIASLLDEAEKAAGRGHLLVVLSSDHGVTSAPEARAARGDEGGRLRMADVEATPRLQALAKRFGTPMLARRTAPSIYLDEAVLRAHGHGRDEAARALAGALQRVPGIAAAFDRASILAGRMPQGDAARAVRRGFCPSRSGDVQVVAAPGWQLTFEPDPAKSYATGHGTPWDDDQRVPLVFAGAGLEPRSVARPVETVDVAPTIADLLGIAPPARASGKVLTEVLR